MADDALPPISGLQEALDDFTRDPALFARWRAANAVASSEDASLDPLMLAAYLDGAADAAERERVEAALLNDPALLDLLIDRRSAPFEPETPAPALLAAARALVPDSAEILAFRSGSFWRRFVPLGAMAASVALVALAGFNLGQHAYDHLTPAATATNADIFDPQTLLQDNELG